MIDAAVESLDELTAPVADSLLGGIRGLAAGIRRTRTRRRARRRPPRTAARHACRAGRLQGNPDAALGSAALAALLGTAEAMDVDLGSLACGRTTSGTG